MTESSSAREREIDGLLNTFQGACERVILAGDSALSHTSKERAILRNDLRARLLAASNRLDEAFSAPVRQDGLKMSTGETGHTESTSRDGAPSTAELVQAVRRSIAECHDDCSGTRRDCPICAEIRRDNARLRWLVDRLPSLLAASEDSALLDALADIGEREVEMYMVVRPSRHHDGIPECGIEFPCIEASRDDVVKQGPTYRDALRAALRELRGASHG